MSLDGASMACEMFQKPLFYNEKGVEARIEAGLDEPRWHVRCYKNHCFYNEKVVEARIEAGLDELRWSLCAVLICCWHRGFLEASVERMQGCRANSSFRNV